MLKKANYRKIANSYDEARPISDENLQLWMTLISGKIANRPKVEILDLGCGTGRFSIPFAIKLGYSVTGADNSAEMLLKAKEKDGAEFVKWDIQDAMSLTYLNNSFDVVFMSHLLHHVENPLKVVKECYRILRPHGLLFNRFGSMEDIANDPEHKFFQGTIKIDKARTPTIKQVDEWFITAGFKDISSIRVEQKTYRTAEERLKKAELKSTSVLTLISQTVFEKGIKNYKKYIKANPNDSWLIKDKMTLISAKK